MKNESCFDTTKDERFIALKLYLDDLKGSDGMAMRALQEAQRIFGYLPLEVHKFVAEHTGIPISELFGITTFYSQFTTSPKGKHQIAVCLGTACYVRGAQKIIDKLSEELGVTVGETTSDGYFTLDAARCLGCCGLSPVMMVDEDVYANLYSVEAIPEILEKYRG
ncbi:MAG TPA: NAD(P)H-dependent oxidoreductase subunit E [Anaerovoracaceae bacterium]|nr:NAD(P)H-dependent oxidoreductase subunit E [Anaerovoracaceae bacterium]